MVKKKILVAIIISLALIGLISFIIVGVSASVDADKACDNKLKIEEINRVPKSPSVICLSPSFVEIMYRINCEDHIMAVTDGCDFPSDAKNLPNLGSSINLDWKLIEQLPIDIVMLTPAHTIEHVQSRKLGKKVIVGEVASLDSIINTMWKVGVQFNKSDLVEQWVMDLDLSLTVLKKKAALRDARGESAPRVLFVLDHSHDFSGKILVAGSKLFYNDVIVKAGGKNAYKGAVETFAMSFDELVALKPDIVIDVVPPVDLAQRSDCESKIKTTWVERFSNYDNLDKTPKVVVFSETWARRPGPRVVELINNVGKIVFE